MENVCVSELILKAVRYVFINFTLHLKLKVNINEGNNTFPYVHMYTQSI